MIAKCHCEHCQNPIEFEAEHTGQTVECPHCAKMTYLRLPKNFIQPAASVATLALPMQDQLEAFDSLKIFGGTDCPSCGSAQTQRMEMTFVAGVSKKRATIVGMDVQGEIGIGGIGGTSQTGLSISVQPPEKRSLFGNYLVELLFGIIALFILIAIIGSLTDYKQGDYIAIACLSVVMFVCLAIMRWIQKRAGPIKRYNSVFYPRLIERWQAAWICLRCGKRWIPEK
jgi:predicted RNA-binding Zn-ribbon protein involved in translation (DUF1610 family)